MPETAREIISSFLEGPRVEPPRPGGVFEQMVQEHGDPAWRDESIPLQRRVNSLLETHARQGQTDWQQIAPQVQAFFPNVNPQQLIRPYEHTLNTEQARQRYERWVPNTWDIFTRTSVPGGAPAFVEQNWVNDANRRLREGNPEPGDYDILARSSRMAQLYERAGFPAQVARTVAGLPAIAGEAWLASGAVNAGAAALGRIPGVAAATGRAAAYAPLTTRALGAIGRVEATNLAMPSMTLPGAAERAAENGGTWNEMRNLGPAHAQGFLNTAILGSVQHFGGRGALGLVAKSALGVGEQAIADSLTAWMDTGLGRKHINYGTIGNALQGQWGELAQHATLQAITFTALGAMHHEWGRQNPVIESTQALLAEQQRQGMSRERAMDYLTQAQAPVLEALRQNPNLTQPEAQAAAQTLPEGPQRRVAEAMAGALPVKMEKPAVERSLSDLATPGRPSPSRVESPMSPEQAAAALAAEQAKGPSRNRVEPRTPPAEPSTPFDSLSAAERGTLAAHFGSTATTPAGLMKAIEAWGKRTGVKPEKLKGMVDALLAAAKTPAEAPAAPPSPPAPPEALRPPEAAAPPVAPPVQPQRPENAWRDTGTKFRDRPDGSLEFTGRNGETYHVQAAEGPAPENVRAKSDPNQRRVQVRIRDAEGREVGHVDFYSTPEGHWQEEGLGVEKRHRDTKERRTGVAAALYDFMAMNGQHVIPAEGRTPEGKRFWERNRQMGEKVAESVVPAVAQPPVPVEPPAPPKPPAMTPEAFAVAHPELSAQLRRSVAGVWNKMTKTQREAAARAMKAEGVPQEEWAQRWVSMTAEQQQAAQAAGEDVRLTAEEIALGAKKIAAREARRQVQEQPLPPELERRIEEAPLADAERTALREAMKGNSFRVIGEMLGVSHETARTRLKKALEKFGEGREELQAQIDDAQINAARLLMERHTERGYAQNEERVSDEVAERELDERLAETTKELEDIHNAIIRSAQPRGRSEASVRREIEAVHQGNEAATVGAEGQGGEAVAGRQTPEGLTEAAGSGQGGGPAGASAATERGAARRDKLGFPDQEWFASATEKDLEYARGAIRKFDLRESFSDPINDEVVGNRPTVTLAHHAQMLWMKTTPETTRRQIIDHFRRVVAAYEASHVERRAAGGDELAPAARDRLVSEIAASIKAGNGSLVKMWQTVLKEQIGDAAADALMGHGYEAAGPDVPKPKKAGRGIKDAGLSSNQYRQQIEHLLDEVTGVNDVRRQVDAELRRAGQQPVTPEESRQAETSARQEVEDAERTRTAQGAEAPGERSPSGGGEFVNAAGDLVDPSGAVLFRSQPGGGRGVAFPEAPGMEQRRAGGIGGGQENAPESQRPQRETAMHQERIDLERAAKDLDELPPGVPRPDAQVWAQATGILRQDPQAGERLVDELTRNPHRAVNRVELAMLLQRRVALDNLYQTAMSEYLAESRKNFKNDAAGQRMKADQAKMDAFDAQMQSALAQTDKLDRATVAATSEAGGVLRFTQRFAAQDYSLTRMMDRAEAARGRPLTETERSMIADMHAKMKELQDKIADMEKKGVSSGKEYDDSRFRVVQIRNRYDAHIESWKRANAPWTTKALGMAGEVLNAVPRSLMASIDFPLLRQGLVGVVTRPLLVPKWIKEMTHMFFSPEHAERATFDIHNRENAKSGLYDRMGIDFTGGPKAPREEGFVSNFLQRLQTALDQKAPRVARMMRALDFISASERGYQVLNLIRADMADSMASSLSVGGKITDAEAKVIGNYVNVGSGRGSLGMFEPAAKAMSLMFFAPKWAVSRFQYLLGQPLYSNFSESAPRARQLVAKEYARFAAGMGMIVGLAALAGFDMEKDPRSSDFGKLKVGNTRLDLTGGLASTARFLAQTMTLSTKNQRGQVMPLSGRLPYGMDNWADVAARFGRGKLAPAPGAVFNLLSGTDVVGQPVTPGSQAAQMVTPLYAKDVYDAMRDLGIPRGTAVSLLGLLGMGMNTHDANAPRPPLTAEEQRRNQEIRQRQRMGLVR